MPAPGPARTRLLFGDIAQSAPLHEAGGILEHNPHAFLLSLHQDPTFMKRCATCGRAAKSCRTTCGIVHYCSEACQRSDWKIHRLTHKLGDSTAAAMHLKATPRGVVAKSRLPAGAWLKMQICAATSNEIRAMVQLATEVAVLHVQQHNDALPVVLRLLAGAPPWVLAECPEFACESTVVTTPLDLFIFARLQQHYDRDRILGAVRRAGWNTRRTERGACFVPRFACSAARSSHRQACSAAVSKGSNRDDTPFLEILRPVEVGEAIVVYRGD
jgi:hypothetical protein